MVMNKDDAAVLRRIADQIDAAAVAVQPEPALPPETVHACPPKGSGIMPCCTAVAAIESLAKEA